MKAAVFSTRTYDKAALERANERAGSHHEFDFLGGGVPGRVGPRLEPRTAALARGAGAVVAFTNDDLGRETLEALKGVGVEKVALRSAGFNNLDVRAADGLGFLIGRVPAYSPHAIAEHTVGLILALNRKIHRAYNRTREMNFSLEGLMGFDLHRKKVVVVGTGAIGSTLAKILLGFGCRVVGVDPFPNEELRGLGVEYVPLDEAVADARIVCLTCPLTEQTHHLIDERAIARMRRGVMLVNTARGAIVDTKALIDALKREHVGSVALDVYEEEEGVFYVDRSASVMTDDVLARLLSFPNVIVTSHQAFFTEEALSEIGRTTIENLSAMARGEVPEANRIPGRHGDG